jgi:hypothetical protein
MAFLDNSGDIILDAVLTDTGRKLLARGDGSFRVTKFAFGDDEINYELYNSAHASGSAYYDLNVLQSPILEAFTNNTSSMKSKLLTLSNNSLRYLPVIQLNTNRQVKGIGQGNAGMGNDVVNAGNATAGSTYVVVADESTMTGSFHTTASGSILDGDYNYGVLAAYQGTGGENDRKYQMAGNRPFVLDQGIDNNAEGTVELPIGNSLYETQYMIEVDNRFFTVISPGNNDAGNSVSAPRSFVDDDNVASYFFALQDVNADRGGFFAVGTEFFYRIAVTNDGPQDTPISGRSGSRFAFRLRVTEEVERNTGTNNYLFTTFGTADDYSNGDATVSNYVINTNVRITGMTTGYRVSIPVQIVKKA